MVTGSHRGIGFETARQLGQQGVRIIVSARTEREAADAASKLRGEGIEAEPLALDATKAADRVVAAKFVEARYGKLDILVNNAGVGPADGIIGLRASESTEGPPAKSGYPYKTRGRTDFKMQWRSNRRNDVTGLADHR